MYEVSIKDCKVRGECTAFDVDELRDRGLGYGYLWPCDFCILSSRLVVGICVYDFVMFLLLVSWGMFAVPVA